ncbi:MAG: hypothetical protein V4795_06740 [Pseudomonadota bacterium]
MLDDAHHPASDRPAAWAGRHADTTTSDEPLMGYECALPWLQAAPPAVDAPSPPWPCTAAD